MIFCFCSLSKGIFNALQKATVINKIVFTSPEAMVEFSREKLKPQCKNPFNMCKLYSFE